MNVSKSEIIGAYAIGMLDASASRGVLTQAAVATLLAGMINIYGEDIPIETTTADADQTGVKAPAT